MKQLVLLALVAVYFLAFSPACKKSNGGGACNEPRLVFTTSPGLNTTEPPAPGPNFPLQVNVTQNLPSSGVSITVTAKPEAGGNAFYTETKTSTAASTSFSITGTPQNVVSIVQVTVTSTGCNTNTASGSYRYTRK